MPKYLKATTRVRNVETANDTQAIEDLKEREKTILADLKLLVLTYPALADKQEEILNQLKDAWAKFDKTKDTYLAQYHDAEVQTTFDLDELELLLEDIENFQFGQ